MSGHFKPSLRQIKEAELSRIRAVLVSFQDWERAIVAQIAELAAGETKKVETKPVYMLLIEAIEFPGGYQNCVIDSEKNLWGN